MSKKQSIPKSMNPALAKMLRCYREDHGLSQEKLGAILGCSQVHILRLETGSQNPGTELIRAMHERLGFSLEEIIYGPAIADHKAPKLLGKKKTKTL